MSFPGTTKMIRDLGEEPNSLTSDESFVILRQGSMPYEMSEVDTFALNGSQFYLSGTGSNTSMRNAENIPEQPLWTSSERNHTSMHSDFDQQEVNNIQIKLNQLVKENLILKETLNQSNLAMKSQFDTLVSWHQEVVKTHESHKEKFRETQEQIMRLRMENARMKKLITEKMEEKPVLCSSCSSTVFVNASSATEMGVPVNQLTERLGLLEISCKDLQEQNEKLVQKNEELEKKSKNLKCEKECEDKQLEMKLKEMEQLNEMKIEKDKCEESLFVQVCKNGEDGSVSVIKNELEELKKTVEEQRDKLMTSSEHMLEMEKQYEKLHNEQKDLEKERKDLKSRMIQLEEEARILTSDVRSKEDALAAKAEELSQMKREMQKLVLNCEEVAILRAQVELYQNDFNEERKAREEAVGEKEKMAEQVRLLERNLLELKKENELRQREQEKQWQDESTASNSSDNNGKTELAYPCPKCWARFATLPECENHVEECLNLDMFP